jgi:hypothetical protein
MKIYHCSDPMENPIPAWMRAPRRTQTAPRTKERYPKDASHPLAELIRKKEPFPSESV